MSEHRQPTEIWTIRRLPEIQGKKPCKKCKATKIELFPAYYWAMDWDPGSTLFYPKPPLRSESRKLYWEMCFRVRIDGVWLSDEAKYVMLARQEILEKYFI